MQATVRLTRAELNQLFTPTWSPYRMTLEEAREQWDAFERENPEPEPESLN